MPAEFEAAHTTLGIATIVYLELDEVLPNSSHRVRNALPFYNA